MAEWNCNNCKYGLSEDYTVCMECRRGSKYKEKPILWGDKIRVMSDEELAEWILKHDTITYCHGRLNTEQLLEWLKSEVKE